MAGLTYRVTADVPGARYGTRSDWQDTRQALADAIAQETRVVRPDLTGPLTVAIWSGHGGEHYRLPAPPDADRFEYPAPASSALEG